MKNKTNETASGKTKSNARPRLKLEAHQVIIKPVLTEKGMFQSEAFNQYTFQVNPAATKTDVRDAIEKLFDVSVDKIAIQNRQGKRRRYRFKFGRTKAWKKAIVKLKGDDKIDFF